MWGLLVRAAVVLAIFGAGWRLRDLQAQATDGHEASAQLAQAQPAAAAATAASTDAAATRVEIRWRTKLIKDRADELLTPQTDRGYPLPVGFVRLHDAAAEGADAPDPGGADDTASDVATSEAAAVIADNYGACLESTDRLTRLQGLLRQYQTIYPAGGPTK